MIFRQFQFDANEYYLALRLREDILRKPLGLTLTTAELTHEADCFHLGGFDGARLQAVLLLQSKSSRTFKMRQVAVAREIQGRGVGSQLIRFAEEFARQHDCTTLFAHARVTALDFYLRLGYTAKGEEFIETTIAHRLVEKAL